MRKITGFSAAATAATLLFTLVGTQSSGAFAQASAPAASTPADTPITDEVVPVFVEKTVVQETPEAAEPASADSLADLIALTRTDASLSDEMKCLAGAVYFESRGEPLAGQLAVAQVVINRSESGQFPKSYCGVVYQRAQFSFIRNGRIPHIDTGSAAWTKARAIARIAHEGLWKGPAEDALFFHANYVSPSWRHQKVALATIDTHIFYR